MKRSLYVLVLAVASIGGGYAAAPPQISAWVARDAAPGPKVRLTINTRNVPSVTVSAHRLEGFSWLLQRDRNPKRPPISGKPVRSWTTSLTNPGDRRYPRQQDIYRSRQVNLPPLSPGIYLLVVQGGGSEAWTVVNVTHLAVVVKRSPKKMLVWVTDAASGAILRGADAGLFDPAGKRLAGGTTGADGAAFFAAPSGSDRYVVVRWRNDLAAVATSVENPDGQLRMHLQTDRPVYRPGQTVQFRAILRHIRDRGYTHPAGAAVQVEVRDPKDMVLSRQPATATDAGTVAGQVDIPSEGAVGPYTVAVTVNGQTAYGQFTVAEYRKPEFRVIVSPKASRYLAGEEVAFQVDAAYYFGSPVPQAGVRYTVRRSLNPFGEVDASGEWYAGGDGNLYPRDTFSSEPFVAEGEVFTDANGRVTIPVKTARDAPDSRYEISCTVTDPSRRQVSASAGVPVYAASLRIGLSTDLLFTSLGSNLPVRVRVADLDGKPAPASVLLTVQKPVWNEKEGRTVYREVTRTRVQVPPSGQATAAVPARAEGGLLVTASAKDGTGRTAMAEMTFWVAGPTVEPVRADDGPFLSLRLDRRLYKPGDTLKASISGNHPERPVLATAEGTDLFLYKVFPAGAKSRIWQVPSSLAMTPNVQLSAVQWIGSHILFGGATARIPDDTRRLQVSVQSKADSYRPGDRAEYLVTTTGTDGKPVPAEVAVSVVDEAIYAVRPDATQDPYAFYWGWRENRVQTSYSAPEELSGGAYQRVNSTAPVRERFLDTAFWTANLRTGPDGTARFTVDIPGNLTSWRATALAVTPETRTGRATSSVRVSRPVMMRLATPRQMVKGDRLVLRSTITNKSGRDRAFEAYLSAENLRVEDIGVRRVDVKGGGEGVVEWTVVADELPASGAATLTGRVLAADAEGSAADLSDALRVPVRIVPPGLPERRLWGGTLGAREEVSIDLPGDRLEPASRLDIRVFSGVGEVASALADRILKSPRYGVPVAVSQLRTAAASGRVADPAVAESLALLSRYQRGDGTWGWWESDPADPEVTAEAIRSLAEARAAGVDVPGPLLERGLRGAQWLYDRTNLWEHRARLISAVVRADPGREEGKRRLEEVRQRGQFLSPYARLALAEAALAQGSRMEAVRLIDEVLAEAPSGPNTATVPVGERAGWTATTTEATALALSLLVDLEHRPEVASKLVRSLAVPEDRCCRSLEEEAATMKALAAWMKKHPDPGTPGDVSAQVNGQPVSLQRDVDGRALTGRAPSTLLRDANTLLLSRDGTGEVFYEIEALTYVPATTETAQGIRVLRRFEIQNDAGIWKPVTQAVPAGAPVRVTVVIWPREQAGPLRVHEPIPSGFEYVDSDRGGAAREEVRDGAVIHYLHGWGEPVTFRYYLRAESEGALQALPASAEVIRRPAESGHSASETFRVESHL